MTGRVGVYARLIVFTPESLCTEIDDQPAGRVHIVNHHVEVHLLWPGSVAPLRRLVVGRELKGKTRGGSVLGNHYPVIAAVGDGQSQKRGVEAGQSGGIWAIDNQVVKASDRRRHTPRILLHV